MDRRTFIKLMAAMAASSLVSPAASFAETIEEGAVSGGKVSVGQATALEMAKRFFSSLEPDKGLAAYSAVPFYSISNEPIGFIVHVDEDGQPFGYIIFDSQCDFGISEFSYGAEAAESPFQSIANSAPSLYRSESGAERLYKLDSLTYCSLDGSTGEVRSNYGDMFEVAIPDNSYSPMASSPDDWKDVRVLMPASDVYRNYNVSSAGSVSGYTCFTQDVVLSVAGRYACAVSAMLTVCSYYVQTGGRSGLKSDYDYLWDASGTTVEKLSSQCYPLGGTAIDQNGPATSSYCFSRGRKLSYSFKRSPSWESFKNVIDSKNMAIFGGALSGDSSSGHAMAVAGYMQLVDKGDPFSWIDALTVFDGWRSGLRILSYANSNFSRFEGTFFS